MVQIRNGDEASLKTLDLDRFMPHLRLQGPLPLKSEVSSPITIDSPLKSSPHSSPPSSPGTIPDIQMADNRTVYQQAFEGFTGDHSPIITLVIDNPNSWQIPSYVITNLIQSNLFHGCDDEDAPAHINRLTRALRTFNLQGANEDAIFLHLFPFSLTVRAATWLDSHPAGAFSTWEALRTTFLKKYFSPAKASRLRDQIHSFHMEPDEPYCQAWERFQGLLARCSQHGLTPWALVEKFYNGLTYVTQACFDTTAEGNLMDKKNVVKCNELFESFARSEFAKKPRSRNSNPGQDQSFSGDQSSQGGNNGQDLSSGIGRLEEMMKLILVRDQDTHKKIADHDLLLRNHQSALLDIQRTVGDIARRLDERPQEELSTVPLNGECSAVVLNKVPEKLSDPGVFTIPCLFGRDTSCQALADLGASINLMPYSLFEKLGLGELTPTRMTLSLADRSVKYPRGIIENLLVKVDGLVFPVDFVVLDMEVDERVSIILGRPFLRTSRAPVDVFDGKITLRAGNDSEEREVASPREAMEFDKESGGGKRKFVEFGGVGDKRNMIEDEWSYHDAVS
ncbi:uncharacterized protein LOC143603144 [Bidens hawaiensis]|uniref:uncharacterized protein LOC143603144 n=1 Tax=Bidens hawaiensis TaxID=980011 RepID=UPI00404A5D24